MDSAWEYQSALGSLGHVVLLFPCFSFHPSFIYLFKVWPPSGTSIKRPDFHPLLLLDDNPINCSARVALEVRKLTIALADQRKNITIRQVQHR